MRNYVGSHPHVNCCRCGIGRTPGTFSQSSRLSSSCSGWGARDFPPGKLPRFLNRLRGMPGPPISIPILNARPAPSIPEITQDNIRQTICNPRWTTRSVRPAVSYTNRLKVEQIREYAYSDPSVKDYEEDHFIPLELGGNPADPKNLWPEPFETSIPDGGAHAKDQGGELSPRGSVLRQPDARTGAKGNHGRLVPRLYDMLCRIELQNQPKKSAPRLQGLKPLEDHCPNVMPKGMTHKTSSLPACAGPPHWRLSRKYLCGSRLQPRQLEGSKTWALAPEALPSSVRF